MPRNVEPTVALRRPWAARTVALAVAAMASLSACQSSSSSSTSSSTTPPTSIRPTPTHKPTTKPTPKPTKPAHARAFHFVVAAARGIPASEGTNKRERRRSTVAAVRGSRLTLDRVYQLAFFDLTDRRAGKFGRAFAFFTGKARGQAAKHERALTIAGMGRPASVKPGRATLVVRVLLDRFGNAFTASVLARFTARATSAAGRVTVISSVAQYFLRPSPAGWRIYAFQVRRADHLGK